MFNTSQKTSVLPPCPPKSLVYVSLVVHTVLDSEWSSDVFVRSDLQKGTLDVELIGMNRYSSVLLQG